MRKKMRLLASLLMISLLAAGCGSSDKFMATESAMATEDYAVEEEKAFDETPAESGAVNADISTVAQSNRKLIRTVDLQIQTREFDTVLTSVQERVQELGGYVEQSSIDSGSTYYSSYNRYSYLTVRIPSDKLDGFLENVKETANVTNISESTEDITLRYVDAESRKIALETEQSRLLTLLEKAETVEDIITIESRLSEVRYQLESYTSQLRTFDNQVDYSTVHINIHEVDRETKVEPKGFWDEVKEEFGNSLYGIGNGIRGFGIWFLGSSPYLIIWAIVIAGVVYVVKFFRKKRIQKRALKSQAPEEKTEKK